MFVAISAKARERLQGRGDKSICNFIKFLIAQVRNVSITAVLWVFSSRSGRQRHQGKFPVPLWIHTTLSHHLFNMPWCGVSGVQRTEGTPELSSGLESNLKGLQSDTKMLKCWKSVEEENHYFTVSKTHSLMWQMGNCFLWYAAQYIACITGWHSCITPRHFLSADAFTFIRFLTEGGYNY